MKKITHKIKLAAVGTVATLLIAAPVLAQGDPPANAGADGGAPVTAPVPAPAPPPAPPAPAAAPAQQSDLSPSTNTTPVTLGGGTVTLGTGTTPKKDEAKKDDASGDEAKPAAVPFAGSSFFFQTGVSPNIINPGAVQSADPVVDSFALFLPRWAFSKDWQVRGRFAFNYEWTDNVNSSTTRKREPRFTDSILTLAFRGIPALAKIKTVVLLNLGLPTSPESQARSLYVSPGIGLAFAREFEHVLGGKVDIALTASYSHPFYHYTTAGLENKPAYAPQCFSAGGNASCDLQASGSANTSNSVVGLLSLSGEWGKVQPSLFMLLANSWAYTFQDLPGVTRLDNPTHFRQATFFGGELDYQFVPWFQAGIGYQMFRTTILDGDGKIGNPFYSQYQQDAMRVYLGATISLDEFYLALSGKAEKEVGPGGGRNGVSKVEKKRLFADF